MLWSYSHCLLLRLYNRFLYIRVWVRGCVVTLKRWCGGKSITVWIRADGYQHGFYTEFKILRLHPLLQHCSLLPEGKAREAPEKALVQLVKTEEVLCENDTTFAVLMEG